MTILVIKLFHTCLFNQKVRRKPAAFGNSVWVEQEKESAAQSWTRTVACWPDKAYWKVGRSHSKLPALALHEASKDVRNILNTTSNVTPCLRIRNSIADKSTTSFLLNVLITNEKYMHIALNNKGMKRAAQIKYQWKHGLLLHTACIVEVPMHTTEHVYS